MPIRNEVARFSTVTRCLLAVGGMHTGKGRIRMEAVIRPELCADLSAPRAYAVPELAGQRLADERIVSSLPCLAEIDLIIGADYCRSAVNYRTIRCRSGLLAVSSRFGREKRPGTPRIITLTTITESTTHSNPESGNVDLRQFWEMEHFGIIDIRRSQRAESFGQF
jgi:hypothetical protein